MYLVFLSNKVPTLKLSCIHIQLFIVPKHICAAKLPIQLI